MAKFYGSIGFSRTVETAPSVYEEQTSERKYFGDIQADFFKIKNGKNLNDEIDINNKLSIVADSFAINHYGAMRYVKWHNEAWEISSVEVSWPRLILSIGGLYNGKTADA